MYVNSVHRFRLGGSALIWWTRVPPFFGVTDGAAFAAGEAAAAEAAAVPGETAALVLAAVGAVVFPPLL
jgi:hypothetical protein